MSSFDSIGALPHTRLFSVGARNLYTRDAAGTRRARLSGTRIDHAVRRATVFNATRQSCEPFRLTTYTRSNSPAPRLRRRSSHSHHHCSSSLRHSIHYPIRSCESSQPEVHVLALRRTHVCIMRWAIFRLPFPRPPVARNDACTLQPLSPSLMHPLSRAYPTGFAMPPFGGVVCFPGCLPTAHGDHPSPRCDLLFCLARTNPKTVTSGQTFPHVSCATAAGLRTLWTTPAWVRPPSVLSRGLAVKFSQNIAPCRWASRYQFDSNHVSSRASLVSRSSMETSKLPPASVPVFQMWCSEHLPTLVQVLPGTDIFFSRSPEIPWVEQLRGSGG